MVSTVANTVKFSQVINSWLEERRARVSDSSYQMYSISVNQYFIPMFGDMTVGDITIDEINRKIEEHIYGSDISYGRARDIISHLKSVLKYVAKEMDIFIDWNKITFRSCEKKELSVLSDDQQKALASALLRGSDAKQAGILICLYTGIQISEMCALKWEDIDLTGKYINIDKALARTPDKNSSSSKTRIVSGEPKNKAAVRKLPINSYIVKLIDRFAPKDNESFFLTGTDHCYEVRRMQRLLDKYGRELEIDKLNYLTIRNTFANNCIRAGCNAEELAKLMGYTSGRLAYEAYEELFVKYNPGFSVEQLPRIV